jgi:hypothetical protein
MKQMVEQGKALQHGVLAVDQVEAATAPDLPANGRRIELGFANEGITTVAWAGTHLNVVNAPVLSIPTGATAGDGGREVLVHYTGPVWFRAISGLTGVVRWYEILREAEP